MYNPLSTWFTLVLALLLDEINHTTAQTGDAREKENLEDEFFGENDFFEIYFIKSYPKSMTTAYENSFTVQTSGLLIRNVKSLHVMTLEFLPANWENSFFPTIQLLDDNSAGHVTWDKTGQLVKRTSFNSADYQQALYLGTMNGEVRSTFLDWVSDEYLKKKQTFSPQAVCEYETATLTPEKTDVSCPISLRNWDTFVIKSLQMLSKYDVKISSVLPVSGQKVTIQCSSVSDKMLYHTKLPSYYQSFYQCMEGTSNEQECMSCMFCIDCVISLSISVHTNHVHSIIPYCLCYAMLFYSMPCHALLHLAMSCYAAMLCCALL
jgi:hypothetical protein